MGRLRSEEPALTFLVERYWPGVTPEKHMRAAALMWEASDAVSREGMRVRYVRSTLMRDDEVVLSYFEATSRGAVEEANRRTGIRFDRIAEVAEVLPDGGRSARSTPVRRAPSSAALSVALALGTLGAVAGWIAWLALAPAVGFPEVSPAGMLNRTLGAATNAPLGWAALLGGLGSLALGYLVATAKGLPRPGLLSGAIFGVVLWLLSGAVLMPLMEMVAPDRSAASTDALAVMNMTPASSPAAMRQTFMMLHLGAGAPIAALIAWLLFGGVLGATASRLSRQPRKGRRGAPHG